ncbi:hypothetical protein MVEN_01280200 [Mycena venus]|uniref:HNH nuclease domain-containing protein n=1 Tax=Mycena venus TaxID=2733690 RepID=A0A8H6Y084_9AGAR|nr:hypothetical protein MVEN_01280200 [Mycena venus]
MEDWFFTQKKPPGWGGYQGSIDRRCYPNSRGRGVHVWASQLVQGEPRLVAGFATFHRLKVCEMFEFLQVLYKDQPPNWALLKAWGRFFTEDETGGQLSDFQHSLEETRDENLRLEPDDDQVVQDGHYIWFKRLTEWRLIWDTPHTRRWPLISRVVTTQASINVSGNTTPTRTETIRRPRRKTDGRCRVTGKLALDRGEPRGQDWSTLHCAHVLPLAWSTKDKMEEMFSKEALQLVEALLSGDLLDNTILMDARVHGWFDDYRFGIWPVQQGGRWYGKIFRFEQGSCDIDGEWLLAAATPAKIPLPAYGHRETSLEREARERDEKEREEDRTPYDLTDEPILQEVLKVHFETCLHWHVKGMGWHK